MAVTINTIADMGAIADTSVSDLTVDDFSTNVEVYSSTKAKEIPTKLNAMAADLKTYLNDTMKTPEVTHLNDGITSIVAHVNQFVTDVTTYINSTVVSDMNTAMSDVETDHNDYQTNLTNQQNTFESGITAQQNTFEGNITTQQTDYETAITTQQTDYETAITNQQTTFETDIATNLGNYLDAGGSAYSPGQVNSLVFTGVISAGDYQFDANGRIVSLTEGPKTTSNITYDAEGAITGFTETILIDGASYSKSFTISDDGNGNVVITEV